MTKALVSRILGVTLLLGPFSSCGGGGGGGGGDNMPPPNTHTVKVGQDNPYGGTSNVFSPVSMTVSVGTTVTWTWVVSGHTVDSGSSCTSDGGFSSHGVQSAGFTLTHTFNTAGTYPYYCTTHCGSAMTGTIIVQ